MKRVIVQIVAEVAVEIDDKQWAEYFEGRPDFLQFQLEENSCPGTGMVGAALERAMARAEEHSVCWACSRGHCANRILRVDDV